MVNEYMRTNKHTGVERARAREEEIREIRKALVWPAMLQECLDNKYMCKYAHDAICDRSDEVRSADKKKLRKLHAEFDKMKPRPNFEERRKMNDFVKLQHDYGYMNLLRPFTVPCKERCARFRLPDAVNVLFQRCRRWPAGRYALHSSPWVGEHPHYHGAGLEWHDELSEQINDADYDEFLPVVS